MSTLLGNYVRKNKTKSAIAVTVIQVALVVLAISLADRSDLEYFSDNPLRATLELISSVGMYIGILLYIYRQDKDQDASIYCGTAQLDKILNALMKQGFSIKQVNASRYACLKRRNIIQKDKVSIMIKGDVLTIEGMERFLDPLMQFRLNYISAPHLRRVV